LKTKLIAFALLAGSSFAGVVSAADGTVNFTGNIMGAACTVSPTSATQTVALGTVSSSSLPSVGSTAAPTKFDIVLDSCPAAATKATIKFDGPSDSKNSSLLALTTGAGVATGVGIGLYESDSSTQIPVGSVSASKNLSSTAATTFTYYAKYMATGTVVAGSANAVSNFTVNYN
jgi:major type 1 subunit fimbrin (pilin)